MSQTFYFSLLMQSFKQDTVKLMVTWVQLNFGSFPHLLVIYVILAKLTSSPSPSFLVWKKKIKITPSSTWKHKFENAWHPVGAGC